MKGCFFKRNKVTRIIALMLAMIMMSAPFFAHAGLQGDSKAEEAGTTTPYTYTMPKNTIALTTNVTDAAIIENGGKYYIGKTDGDNIDTNILSGSEYQFAADYLTLKINSDSIDNQINLSVKDYVVDGKTLSASFDNEVYYSYENDVAKIQKLAGSEITITKADLPKTIYFWLKPIVTDTESPSNSYDTAWQPVYYVEFVNETIIDDEAVSVFMNDSTPTDAEAPDISLYLIGKDTSENIVINREISISASHEYINPDKANSYFIKIVADDGPNGSGIDVGASLIIKGMSGNGFELKTNTEGKTGTFEISVEKAMAQYNYTIYDKAGNDVQGALLIHVDNTPPTIGDIHATVENTDPNTKSDIENLSTSYYNQNWEKLTLKAEVTDTDTDTSPHTTEIDTVYLYYKKDSDALYEEVNITTNKNGNVYSYDASSLEDGEYTFYFKAVDKAGNIATSESNAKTFKVDKNPPKRGTPSYQYRVQKEDGNWEDDWHDWGMGTTNSGQKYVFNTALMEADKIQYSVVVTATDDSSGMKEATIKTNNGTSTDSVTDGSEVRYTFKTSDLSNDTVVEISFTDKAGNETTGDENYRLTKDDIAIANTDIAILSSSLKIYETGNQDNELDLHALTGNDGKINAAINKNYTISVEVTSGYEINAASLSAVLSDGTTDLTIGGSCGENKFDAADGKNKSVVTFVVPGEAILNQKNEKLQDITLTVKDNRCETDGTPNPQSAEKTIGQILYDISRPRLESTNADDEWHKDFKPLSCRVVSEAYVVEGETLPDVESGLSWLNYKITNSTADTETQNTKDGVTEGTTGIEVKIDDVPESLTPYGTIITFNAEDRAGNGIYDTENANVVVVKVDKTKPSITSLAVQGNEGDNHKVPYGGQPVIKAVANDNLTLDKVVVEVVYPDGTTKKITNTINQEANGSEGITEPVNYTVEKVDGEVLDGEYRVETYALDKAGRQSDSKYTTFRIDNSKPVVTARVIAGTASPKTVAPYYYKDNVSVELTYQDDNMPSSGVQVTDNGNTVEGISWAPVDGVPGKYRAVVAVTAEGSHNIAINATDVLGNNAEPKTIAFVVDKASPNITAYVNGTTVYNDSMGNLMLTGTTTVSMNVSDMTRDDEDNYVQIQKNVPNGPASNPAYIRTSNTNMTFNDEADYVVNFYAVDRANNTSATKTVRFRVDRTAPELSISGGAGGTSASATTVTFTMREAFWWDANASLTIYKKAGDGAREELYKTVSFNPSAYQTSVSEALSGTGVYRFEFEARDNVGHRSSLSQTLTIDLDAPVVVLKGVNDYDMTDGAVEFSAEITDDFYSSKKVSISGTRTDMDGKVYKLDFGAFLQSANPTTISQTFKESGVYDITLVTSDIAGNEHKENVHFTIDNAAPVIGDLSKYDGKIFKSFSWDEDLDELVSDLTVCDVQMFLNGSEYDGSSDIADGSYVLLIVATDEMGHRTEKEVRFELDTKAPVFIVTGVEDKEVKNEDYIINVSLQLDEDTLSKVTLNGTNISVRDNTATINVTEKGEYTLVLNAYDAAGNEAAETITFTYGEEKSLWWIWIIIACGIILLGTIIIIIAKKKKEDEQ